MHKIKKLVKIPATTSTTVVIAAQFVALSMEI
jgi:hypothetical protein